MFRHASPNSPVIIVTTNLDHFIFAPERISPQYKKVSSSGQQMQVSSSGQQMQVSSSGQQMQVSSSGQQMQVSSSGQQMQVSSSQVGCGGFYF